MNATLNNLKLLPVNDLLKMKFYVPSYQRGYRWTDTQVQELLKDIWEFRQASEEGPKSAFYCLQPIVVTRQGDEWVLIDGQQRLTTIFIILSVLQDILLILGKNKFEIRYATRPDSGHFLKQIVLTQASDNIDYHHMCEAYIAVKKWFDSQDGTAKFHFLTTLTNDVDTGKNVQVIWYEVNDGTDPIDVFTRLNIGKIPLTNAELVKALLLSNIKANTKYTPERAYLLQTRIASEWDAIEVKLQNPSFWHFIYEGDNRYDTRIEFIFDLMQGKNVDDESNFTFYKFQAKLQDGTLAEDLWHRVKRSFQQFEEWYEDRELYHLIGYLIATGTKIPELMEASKGQTKTQFRRALTQLIRAKCRFKLEDLEYKDDRIKSLLLLFNIQTIIANPNCSIRFPFDRFKDQHWDIEHVRSVKSDMPTGSKRRKWLENVLEYLQGVPQGSIEVIGANENTSMYLQKLSEMIGNGFSDEEFKDMYGKILKAFKEDSEPDTINGISNLALLDQGTNRSYGNAVFPMKRKRILENDYNGTFVPICTRNVFLKAYSRNFEEAMFWRNTDAKDYLEAIKSTLKVYFENESKPVKSK